MKSIGDMQKRIDNLVKELSSIKEDINQYAVTDNKWEDNLEQIFTVAARYAFSDHPLKKAEHIIKKEYLLILMAISSLTIDKNRALYFVGRIAAGVEFKESLTELYSVDVAQIQGQQINSFTKDIINENLGNYLALDLLLVCYSNNADEKVIKFSAGIIELLGISKETLKELAELAHIIVTKDETAYLQFCRNVKELYLDKFFYYIKLFHQGIIELTSKQIIVESEKEIELDYHSIELLRELQSTKMVFMRNISFRLYMDNDILKLSKSQNITSPLRITNNRGEVVVYNMGFDFKDCDLVYIENCNFILEQKDLKYEHHFLGIDNTKSLKILNSEFIGGFCELPKYGCKGLELNNVRNIFINNSIFKYCYAYNIAVAIEVSSSDEIKISNCKFYKCKSGDKEGSTVYFYNSNKIIFIDNILEGCRGEKLYYYGAWAHTESCVFEQKSNVTENHGCRYIDCDSVPYEFKKDS